MNDETKSQIQQDIHMFRVIVGFLVLTLAISTVFFHKVEGWKWLDSFYYTVVTVATVGYGDFVPVTDKGKIGAMVLIVIGISLFTAFASQLIKRQAQRRQNHKNNKK